MRARKIVVASTPEALAAMASPLRLEIVDWFQGEEELSIREVAERLGRKPSSITYHVRLLEKAGLLVEVGRGTSGKRTEAVYSLAAADVQVGQRPYSPATRKHRVRMLRTLVRQAAREYERALEAPEHVSAPPYATRQRARLTATERRALQKHVEAIREIFQQARTRRRGRTYAVTVVLNPVTTPD